MKLTKKNILDKTNLVITGVLISMLPIFAFLMISSKSDRIFGIQSFSVQSGSMAPALPVGSIVLTKKTAPYFLDDIITFKNKAGIFVTHRVASVSLLPATREYETKGDVNKEKDSEKVSEKDVVGKVMWMIPFIGYVATFLKTLPGLILLIIIPCLLLVLFELKNIHSEMLKEIEKKVKSELKEIT